MKKHQGLDENNPVVKGLGLKALFNELDERKDQATPPASMKDLEKQLKSIGDQWREEHKEVKKKNGQEVEVVHRVPARSIAYMLEKVVTFAVIGDNEKDIENAPLTFYDLDTGLYTKSERTLDHLILSVDDTTNSRSRKEIREWLRVEAPSKTIDKDINLIPVGNGIYDRKNEKLLPFTSNHVFTSKVATTYINKDIPEPNFNGWTFSHWIEELSDSDKDKTTLLWQMIASVIQNRRTSNVMFCLVDNETGQTGKSTFEALLMNLVGEGNYSALKLEEFDHPFLLAQAYGANLIIGDDNNPKGYIDDGSALKSIVTNELVLINPKGQRPFSAKFYCTIVQSMNGFPRFKDTSGGLYRRFRLIKFTHQYPDTPEGRKVKNEYIKEPKLLQWILKRALQVNIDTIINTNESKAAIEDLQLENDIVLSFVQDVIPDLKSGRLPIDFLFALFRKYADDSNSATKMTRTTFTRRMKPLMAQRKWQYKNAKPGEQLKKSDTDRLVGTKYYDFDRFQTEAFKVKRCFIRE